MMPGRIRTIKPETLEDELACELSDTAWRMWVGMWLLCDDHGNVRASARYLAAHVWQDTGRLKDAKRALKELSTKIIRDGQQPMIAPYSVDGQEYAHIKGFKKHQRMDNAGKPRVPGPPEKKQEVTPILAETRGESQRLAAKASEPAALPPTSDLRPPTPTSVPNTACPAPTPSGLELDGEPEQKPRRKTKRAEQLPDSWAPTDAHRELARTEGRDCDREATKFRDHAEATGRVMKDWNAAFRTWLRSDIGRGRAPKVQPTSGRDWTKTAKVNR
jgi:hypothetical protein